MLSVAPNLLPGAAFEPSQFLFERSGFLSRPSSERPLEIAARFLAANADRLGVTAADLGHRLITDQYASEDTGMTHIYLRQQFLGREVVNANLNVNLTADGRVLSVGGGFVRGLAALESIAAARLRTPVLTAAQAIGRAAAELDLTRNVYPTRVIVIAKGPASTTELVDRDLSLDPIQAKLAYVATGSGVQLAWHAVLRTPDKQHWYEVNVDATDGSLLLVDDWVKQASYDVLALPTENPNDGQRTLVTDPHDPAASPYGWHDANGQPGAEYTDTRGNNVWAQEDRNADNNGGWRPRGGSGLNFDFPLNLSRPPILNQAAAITNLFYWNNRLHDVHYKYGFTEVAGNFQTINYSGQGEGGDQVMADAQDGSGSNNANFATPPDGRAPRMQMFVWSQTRPPRDGDLENTIMIHEYGHGVSTRLVGGPSNVTALNARQSGGIGEGLGDWWALMFTQKPTDAQMDPYSIGNYVVGQGQDGPGIRRYPYSFDMSVDPLTYGAYNESSEVHDAGEIWCSAMWDLNWLLVDKYGYNANIAAGYTGAGSAGNTLALQLAMDALKIMPVQPTFLDARDAILQADQVLTGGANWQEIWTAFARRGMGYSASDGGSANATTVQEAFDVPPALQSHAVAVEESPPSSEPLTLGPSPTSGPAESSPAITQRQLAAVAAAEMARASAQGLVSGWTASLWDSSDSTTTSGRVRGAVRSSIR